MQYMGKTIFAERTYRALCFEYMQNGSLQKHISGTVVIFIEYKLACKIIFVYVFT
jgi:hypothetical protein